MSDAMNRDEMDDQDGLVHDPEIDLDDFLGPDDEDDDDDDIDVEDADLDEDEDELDFLDDDDTCD